MLQWTFMWKCLYRYMFSVLFDIYPGVGLLGYVITLFIAFWRAAKLSCNADTSLVTMPAMRKGSNVFTISLILAIVCLFYYSHPSGSEMVPHCRFYLNFLVASWWESFHVLIGHWYDYQGFYPFLIGLSLLLNSKSYLFFLTKFFIRYIFLQYFIICTLYISCTIMYSVCMLGNAFNTPAVPISALAYTSCLCSLKVTQIWGLKDVSGVSWISCAELCTCEWLI